MGVALLVDDNGRNSDIVEVGGVQGSDSQNNAQAQISITGVAGKSIYLTSVFASFSAAPAAAESLVITDGTLTYTIYILGTPYPIILPTGLKFTAGATVTITLAASGTVGVYGNLVATGLIK